MSESKIVERPVRSPCVSVCVLNDDDICTGCFRSGKEISYWGRYDNEEKQQVLTRCYERAQAMGAFF